MNCRRLTVGGLTTMALTALLVGGTGCPASVFKNLTKERSGNVRMQFINNTGYRASFSYGTWDAWDRTPGTINFKQLRLEAYTASTVAELPCARNAAVGTQGLVARAKATKVDLTTDFDADAFDTVVHFSSAPEDSDAAALPTAGTAEGIERLLGVHYSCEDRLVFIFNEDPAEPGGFRVDYEVILDVRPEEK